MRIINCTLLFIFVACHTIHLSGQIKKGYKTIEMDEEYLNLVRYFSLLPASRVGFAEKYYTSPDMFESTAAVIKFDLDGLANCHSSHFFGIGFTGPNLLYRDSLYMSLTEWSRNIHDLKYRSQVSLKFPAFPTRELGLYTYLIEYCKNDPCNRLNFLKELIAYKEFDILLLFLIKADLDGISSLYTHPITEEGLEYINLITLEENIAVWDSVFNCN